METLPALLTVGGSYAGYLLAWRRVRIARRRRLLADVDRLATYDHRALAADLADLLEADDTTAEGPTVAPHPGGPIGELPAGWLASPWHAARPSRLAAARDELLVGRVESAIAAAAGAPPAAIRSLFTWGFLMRLFGGDLGLAEEVAERLPEADPGAVALRERLLARLEAVRAELAPAGEARVARCAAGMRRLRRARQLGARPTAAEIGLAAHFEVLRLTLWDLEWRTFRARRLLRRGLRMAPHAPWLHLVAAHLDASLGDGAGAADQLARALYYGRGDRFYARTVARLGFVGSVRPALLLEARSILAGAGSPH